MKYCSCVQDRFFKIAWTSFSGPVLGLMARLKKVGQGIVVKKLVYEQAWLSRGWDVKDGDRCMAIGQIQYTGWDCYK